MLNLAAEGNAKIVVDSREIHREGTSFTVDTVHALRVEFPSDELFLLVGADAAAEFVNWRESGEIADIAHVVVLTRPGSKIDESVMAANVLQVPAVEISSTAVRAAVERGEPIDGMVPSRVAHYIWRHGIYKTGNRC